MPVIDGSIRPAGAETLAAAARSLDEQGFCLIEDLIAPELVAALERRLDEQARAEREIAPPAADDAQLDGSNQYVYALVNKGDVFVDLVLHPTILALAEHVLGRDFLLSASDGILAHPGGSLMPLHSDQWWMPAPVPRGRHHRPVGNIARFNPEQEAAPAYVAPPVVFNVMWMISPFAEQNGATRVVPGTHLSGELPDPAVPHRTPSVPATGRAGTAMVFDGRLWHATGANRTERSRLGIITAYCGPQFRPMENCTIAVLDAVLERNPDPRLRDLLGFKVWQGYGKLDDPAERMIDRRRQVTGPMTPGAAS
ncbi:phytanoyl-CoA dioxygenase family protein [Zavarzinia sp.]|uniref:phytanoyl-CoA dioxygenase family protein n=1 Tax=Zavarzinia sp. TaxID=2027920 RepID=UPI003562CC1D